MTAYPHEVILGVKHAGAYWLVPVVEADYVKAYSLRYSQEKWQQPNRHNLNDCQQGDAHSLNSAPRCHSPVPVKGRQQEWLWMNSWVQIWKNKKWKHWNMAAVVQLLSVTAHLKSKFSLYLLTDKANNIFLVRSSTHLTATTNCSVSKGYQNVKN